MCGGWYTGVLVEWNVREYAVGGGVVYMGSFGNRDHHLAPWSIVRVFSNDVLAIYCKKELRESWMRVSDSGHNIIDGGSSRCDYVALEGS